jgi:hypothetical protein
MTLRIAVYAYRAPEVNHWAPALAEGISRVCGARVLAELRPHGLSAEEIADLPWADVHVHWSMRAEGIFEHCRTRGGVPVTLEHGYVGNRRAQTSVNFWGLNGESQLVVPRDNPSRCRLHGWPLEWSHREPGRGPAVVVGQRRGDMSLKGADVYEWARDEVSCWSDGRTLFRPHPLERCGDLQDVGCPLHYGSLEDALGLASRIVTLSSTAGVNARLAGVPHSAASPVSMVGGERARWSDREWIQDISFRQFTLDEMASGLPWSLYGRQMLDATPDFGVPTRNWHHEAVRRDPEPFMLAVYDRRAD